MKAVAIQIDRRAVVAAAILLLCCILYATRTERVEATPREAAAYQDTIWRVLP